jgi:cytochrome c553
MKPRLLAAIVALLICLSASLPAAERSSKWPALRRAYLTANPTCAACGGPATVVHHVLPFHLYPKLELEWGNLMAFCGECHFVVGHRGNWRDYNPCAREDAAYRLWDRQAREAAK